MRGIGNIAAERNHARRVGELGPRCGERIGTAGVEDERPASIG
jgi:hypothetical protein